MHQETERSALEAMAEGQGAEGAIASSGASPGESPYYNRIFWASYKGQSRGQWGGILLGGGLGSVAGLAIAGTAALATGVGFITLAPAITAVAAVGGMMYAKDVFGTSGAVAGAVAAGMEISEERRHIEELNKARGIAPNQENTSAVTAVSALQVAAPTDLMSDYAKVGHMASGELAYTGDEQFKLFGEKHHDIDERPLYFGKVGLAGAAIGGVLAGAVAFVGGGFESALEHTDIYHHLTENIGGANPADTAKTLTNTVVTASGAAVGATYGINRHYFRNVFNVSNAMYDGHIDEIGKQQAQQEQLESIQERIVELQRQRAAAAAAPLLAASEIATTPISKPYDTPSSKNVNMKSAILAERYVTAPESHPQQAMSAL
jgi:hypothetical protein